MAELAFQSALEPSSDDSFDAFVPGDLTVECMETAELGAVLALPSDPVQHLGGQLGELGVEVSQPLVVAEDVGLEWGFHSPVIKEFVAAALPDGPY